MFSGLKLVWLPASWTSIISGCHRLPLPYQLLLTVAEITKWSPRNLAQNPLCLIRSGVTWQGATAKKTGPRPRPVEKAISARKSCESEKFKWPAHKKKVMFHRGGEGFTRKGCTTLISWWFEDKISRFPDFVQVEDLLLCNGWKNSKLQLFSRKVSNHDGKKKDVHILHLHPYPLPHHQLHQIIQPLALTCTSSTWPVILSRMPWKKNAPKTSEVGWGL